MVLNEFSTTLKVSFIMLNGHQPFDVTRLKVETFYTLNDGINHAMLLSQKSCNKAVNSDSLIW